MVSIMALLHLLVPYERLEEALRQVPKPRTTFETVRDNRRYAVLVYTSYEPAREAYVRLRRKGIAAELWWAFPAAEFFRVFGILE